VPVPVRVAPRPGTGRRRALNHVWRFVAHAAVDVLTPYDV